MLRSDHRRAGAPCLAGLALVLALGLAGCDMGRRTLPPLERPTAAPVEVSSEAPSPAQSSVLPATAVGSVPLGIDDVNRLVGKGLYKNGDRPLTAPTEAKGTVDPPECRPALHALQNKAVSGTAFNGFFFVVFPASDDSNGVFEEAVGVYPELASATTVFQKLSGAVGPCDGKTVQEQQDGASGPVSYEIAVEDSGEGALRWSEHEKGASDEELCVFEARIVRNLLFEVVECGKDAGALVTKAADIMATRAV